MEFLLSKAYPILVKGKNHSLFAAPKQFGFKTALFDKNLVC
jgi:hypothetical protein